MGKIFRKRTLHLIFICLCLTIFFSVPVSAKPKAKPSCAKEQTVYVTNAGTFSVSDVLYIKNTTEDAKFVSVTSSNKAIGVKAAKYYGQPVVKIDVSENAKNGTKGLVTIVLKDKKVQYTLKCTVTVKKSAPLKKVSIGTKKFTSITETHTGTCFFFKKVTSAGTVKAGKAQKIQIIPDASAEVSDIIYVKGNEVKHVKNGSKITLKKGGRLIVNYWYNPKNRDENTFLCGNILTGYFSIDII